MDRRGRGLGREMDLGARSTQRQSGSARGKESASSASEGVRRWWKHRLTPRLLPGTNCGSGPQAKLRLLTDGARPRRLQLPEARIHGPQNAWHHCPLPYPGVFRGAKGAQNACAELGRAFGNYNSRRAVGLGRDRHPESAEGWEGGRAVNCVLRSRGWWGFPTSIFKPTWVSGFCQSSHNWLSILQLQHWPRLSGGRRILTDGNNREYTSGFGNREGKLGSIAETCLEWRKRPSGLLKRCRGYVSLLDFIVDNKVFLLPTWQLPKVDDTKERSWEPWPKADFADFQQDTDK